MEKFTDLEVTAFIKQQEQNFALTARGSGFEANQARRTLNDLARLTADEKMALARMNLEKIHNKVYA